MKRNVWTLILKLLRLVGPFISIIILAIINGTVGAILAMNIIVFAGVAILKWLGISITISYSSLFIIIILSGILRGVVRYFEQYSNHYIAFKILAILRDKIFGALRRLCPAKLEGKNRGEMISLIQGDIETLEVFYAHTITPIGIAFFTTLSVFLFIGFTTNWIIAGVALLGHILVGILLPILFYYSNHRFGTKYRKELGEFQDFYLDSIYGDYEIISQRKEAERLKGIQEQSSSLNTLMKKIESKNTRFKNITNAIIVLLNIFIIVVGAILIKFNKLDNVYLVLAFMTFTCSFGSVIALANLPAYLTMTFASGNRVLNLLEEPDAIREGSAIKSFDFKSLKMHNVGFSYQDKVILKNVNLEVAKGDIVGILGPSGCGKSTLLKLLMHFYEVQTGSIFYNGHEVKGITFQSLYENVNLFSQDTYLFCDTIYQNLLIAKPEATKEEVITACINANIYEYIQGLPNGFDTKINDLQDNLSSGEKQRLGLARVFLRKPKLLLLDEATANIDAINEGMILKALQICAKDMAIIMISHKVSTLSICEKVYELKEGSLCLQ